MTMAFLMQTLIISKYVKKASLLLKYLNFDCMAIKAQLFVLVYTAVR